ncbi:hypothetical protein HGO38_01485 [Rhizobium sp. CG5]|uniref:head-tail connector protein n=1 Tax=Rhizobium sp. CG5 TaxID=2726076 RepID=UPI00203351A9|nr:hypothetical protein [Rhizobium sp. CG5]MCM2472148.1 hypothetical protein [Rhizobium sp. CG5]
MHRPFLVTAPATLPVTVEEAMRHCRIAANEDDAAETSDITDLLTGYIGAAVNHLDGWAGILGSCMVSQVWRQDFDRFSKCLDLPLGPVISIDGVTWRNSAGQVATVAAESYSLRTSGGGMSYCRFVDAFSLPSDLYEVGGVSVTYTAGYADGAVPRAIRQAILLMVGTWFENREEAVVGVSAASLPNAVAVDRLIAPFRKTGL